MQKLALICSNNPAVSEDLSSPGFSSAFALRKAPPSPPHDAQADIWKGGKLFDGLFSALLKFLEHDKPEEVLEYGLIVLWEMLDHQASYIEGHESEIFTLLFRIRYSNKHSVRLPVVIPWLCLTMTLDLGSDEHYSRCPCCSY